MTASTEQAAGATIAQVFQVFIKTTPQAIWDAITQPEWTQRYGYGCRVEYDLHAGGAFRTFSTAEMAGYGAPDVIIEGEVVESDPPHRLVHTWHAQFEPGMLAEGARRVTWEIEEREPGLCRLTVTHDLQDAPITAITVNGRADAGGGWPYILSDLKTLLETGSSLAG
jgi:uncharacterized protein YndB with AHSA1/START domain